MGNIGINHSTNPEASAASAFACVDTRFARYSVGITSTVLLAFSLVLATLLMAATPAQANITPTLTASYPTSTKAGAHSSYRQIINVSPSPSSDDVKHMQIDFPAGLIGNPNAVPNALRCTVDYTGGSPDYSGCPSSSDVGGITVTATSSVAGCHTITLTGNLYVLRNRPGATPEVPTHLGIHVSGTAHTLLLLCVVPLTVNLDMTARINLRDSDSGLRVKILDDITRTDPIIGGDIRVNSIDMTVDGLAKQGTGSTADDIPFLTNPTRCDAWVTTVYTRAYDSNSNADVDLDPVDGTNDYKKATSTLASPDCSSLASTPYNPGFTLTAANAQAGAPTALTAVLTNTVPVTPGTNVAQPSYTKRVDLPLPAGYTINPAIANKIGASGCSDVQFKESDPDAAPTCPAATEIGTVSIATPLITGAVAGKVYLGSPGPSGTGTDRYRLFVYATNGASVKFEGRAAVAADGDVTVTFGDSSYDKSLPQFPFTTFTLVFDSGTAARQMIVNPQSCGVKSSVATLTPWTNPTEAAATRTNNLTVTAGSNGNCNFDAFNPTFTANVSDVGAGKHPNLTFDVTRSDRQDNINDMTFSLPTGMSGSLTSTAATCSAVTAAAGTCTSTSQVGTIAVTVGSGAETISLNGTVHVNTTADTDDVGKLSIQIPAVVGPFDLGKVVIYSRLHLRSNMGIDSINASMPQFVQGIPVHYRSVSLALTGITTQGTGSTADDKPFLQNPSTCGTLSFDASITSAGESPAGSATTVARSDTNQSTTGCPTPFNPSLTVTPSTTETAKPTGLTVAITVPQTTVGVTSATVQSSTATRVQLTMPVGLQINPAFTNGLTECSTANIDAGGDSCASSSQIGTIALVSPLLSGTQSGKVFIEQQGGTPTTRYKLGLVIDLGGATGQPLVLHGTAQVNGSGGGVGAGNGQITADIDNIPDLPFSSFSLVFNSGSNAMFTNPLTCASQSFSADITPRTTGGVVATRTSAYTTSYDGAGASCPGSDPFVPTFSESVSTTVAGAHPNLTLTIDRPDKNQQLRDFTIDLPDGLAGAAAAAPTCTQVSADAGTCGTTQIASRVGTITTNVGSGSSTLSLSGTLYNTVSPANQASRLTAIVPVVAGPFSLGTLSIPTDITLRTTTLGLHATNVNLPQSYEGIPVRFRQIQIVLNGLADQGDGPGGNDVPYLTNSSKCQVNTTNVSLVSALNTAIARTATYTTTGCPIAFNPTITTALSSTASAQPTGLTLGVNLPAANSTIKRMQLTMPTGVGINPAFAIGLTACATATIDAGGSGCASSSQIGTATLTTPLLAGVQTGKIFVETPGGTPTTRYKIAIVIDLPGQIMVMHGQALLNGSGGGADAGTGVVTADFDNLPDLPFSNLTAVFNAGDSAMLTNPETCGSKTFSATITPHTTGGPDATPTSSNTISYDGAGASCPGSDPFSPTFAMSVSDTNAGAHPDVAMTFTRADKQQALRTIAVHFPVGFAASATAAATCSQASAAAGTCDVGNAVGSVDVSVGSGPSTYALSGTIYNTETSGGEAGRLTAVIHVVVGPYDLGYLAVPVIATIRSDYGIDASATLPTLFEGVPVRVRSMVLALDGTGPNGSLFTNSSECKLNTTNVDMASPASAATATGSYSFNTTSCPVPFNPGFSVASNTTENGQPNGLTIGITVPAGHSTMKRVQLTFPVGMELNPAAGTGLTACSTVNLDAGAGACAASSELGTVSLDTPLLLSAQTGKVYLEQPGATPSSRYKIAIVVQLPGRPLVLHATAQVDGNGSGQDTGDGHVTVDVNNIPDLPFTAMTIALKTGDAALLSNPIACGNATVSAGLTPHTTGGAQATRSDTRTISFDGAGALCPDVTPFSPTFSGSVSTTVAGAHPNLTMTVNRPDKHQLLRKVKFSLPVGLAGSAVAATACTQVVADAGDCAVNTEVGTVSISVGSGPSSYTVTGKIHNTVAPSNRPAKFTAIVPVVVGPYDLGKIVTPIDVSLRSDLGIDAETGNLPTRWEGIPVRIRQLQTVLNGTVGGNSFLTNPSKCQVNTTNATMTAPSAATAAGNFNFTTTGCPQSFNPSITAAASSTTYGQPNGLTLGVNVPNGHSTVKKIDFLFPAGMEINPAAGNGLVACSTVAIDAGGSACAAGSIIGTTLLTTPLLAGTMAGNLYLETPGGTASDRYKIAVVVHLPGRDVVMHGIALVNGDGSGVDVGTGRVNASFDNLPDLPWTNLTIVMNTGDRALMTNPAACGTQTVSADITPNTDGGSTATRTANFSTSYDGVGGSCPGTDPFAPAFTMSVTETAADAHPDVTLTVTRGDKQKKLRKVKFELPIGFTGSAAAAPTCTQVNADAGNCALNSKIGQVVLQVGSGTETFQLTGNVYNTVPPSDKPAKMTVIVPAVVGPYDLGKVIVPVNIGLRSGFGIDAETGDLPLRFNGIPVRIRSMATTLYGTAANGPFITNPSKCQTNTFDVTMTSEAADVVNASAGFDTTGCPSKFKPSITAAPSTSEYGQPTGLGIGINVPANNSTVKRIQLALPLGVDLNPAVGNGIATCSTADIDAGGAACPVASEMGVTTLTTPLLASPQVGKLYLESPGLTPSTRYKLGIVIHIPDEDFIAHGAVQISGNGAGSDSGNGQISVDFNDLPDITFSNFTVDMRSGSRALITNPTNCGTSAVVADITPNTTGGAVVTRNASFTTDYNGSGGACPGDDPLVTTLDFQLGINAHTSLPESTQVGKHPDVSIKVTRADKSEAIRSLKLRLPNGFTGSAAAAPTCLKVDADAGDCATSAPASQLGTISVKVGSGAETYNVTGGKIFNTVAPSNRPALLTAIIPVVVGPYDLGEIIQPIDTTLDSNNFQLTAEASNLPLRHEGIPVRIREMQIDLAGYADQATPSLLDDQPFITNPHSCGTHVVYADATSPRPQTVTASDTIDITGCPSQFSPAPTVTVDNPTTAAGKPTAIDVAVDMGSSNDATVKKLVMPFPAGFKLNAGGAEGTTACSAASLDTNTCAASSKVGTSTLVSPLLNSSLTGNVYLETPGTTAADRYKLAVRLTGPVDITIRGVAVVDEDTGDITAVFDNLPDLPFSTFDMHLTGYDADGPGGNPAVPLILNPMDSCGTPTVTTTLSPYGGGNDATPTDTLSVTGCPVAHGFTPTFDLNLSTTQAGANPDTVFTITRPETDEDLKDVQVTLPPGFMGSAAAVPLCSVADADAGTCAAASKIGSVLAHVGYGSDLLTVNGEVFMTAPQDPADIAGLIIRLPAVAGPYNLGLVNVKSRVILRSDSDFGLTTDFKAIPNVFKGVPIPIRDMALTINGTTSAGNKVLYNASACSAASFDATFTSHAASTATGTGAYTPTGCESRSFQPTMHAEMDAKATAGNLKKAPSWDLDLSIPSGDSTVKNITTVLPPVMAYNLIPIGNQCTQAQIDAQGCTANSKYGEVSVTTPLLPYEVKGNIFMGDPAPGVALPRLVIKIGAPINLQVIGINDLVGGSIVSTFSNIPDLIFSNMRLHLFGDADIPGRGGILRLNSKASCTAAPGTATSHSGQTSVVNTTWGDLIDGTCGTEAAGCADPVVSVASKGMRGAKGRKTGKLTIAFGFKSDECYTLSSFQVRLPKGSTVNKRNFIKSLTGTTDTDRRLKGTDFSPRGKDGVRAKTLNNIKAQGITITSKAGALVIPPKALCVGMKGRALVKCGKKKLKFHFVYAKNGKAVNYDYYISPLNKKLK